MVHRKQGVAYGVGVGPGDPELMTLKAVKIIREADIIAVPGANPAETAAYRIAIQSVSEITDKTLIGLTMPMTQDREVLASSHREAADAIESFLDRGLNVAFLTLGDPTIYSTFTYVQAILQMDGYETRLVSGIPSFCAAAARLNIPLGEWDEPIHILPATQLLESHLEADSLPKTGTCILMKSGRRVPEVKNTLRDAGMSAQAVENCAMPGEQVYRGVEEIPDSAGYFTLVIAKDKNL